MMSNKNTLYNDRNSDMLYDKKHIHLIQDFIKALIPINGVEY